MNSFRFVILLAILFGTVSVEAISLPVVNPGFEDTTGSASNFNEFTFGAFLGWDLYDDLNAQIGNGASNPYFLGTLTPQPDPASPGDFINFPAAAPEGQRVAIAFNRAGTDGQGEYGLQQTLTGTPLLANRRYTLQVEIGNIATGVALSGENFILDGFPGYRVELLAGGQPIDSDNNTLAGTILDGEWATSTVTFTTNSSTPQLGGDLGIRLINLNQLDPMFPGSDIEVDFDDVRLDVVPAVDGDFNFDCSVDVADYTVWRDGLSVDFVADDYTTWSNNYGASISVTSEAMSVPEPGGMALFIALVFIGTLKSHGISKRIF